MHKRTVITALTLGLSIVLAAFAGEPVVKRADNVYASGTAVCPDAVVAANGDIIVTFTNHGDVQPGCENLFIRSSDGGKTWSKVYLKLAADDPKEHGVGVCGFLRCDDGSIIAALIEIYMPGGQLAKHQTSKLEVIKSTDNGESFQSIAKVKYPAGKLAAPYGPMVRLADKSIIMSGYMEDVGCGYWQTRDDGKTWTDFRVVWEDPPEGVKDKLWFNETAYVVLNDGSVLAMARNDRNDLFYTIVSKDNGKTWTKPRVTNIVGGSPALHKLADGSVILAQRDSGRPGLGIYQSRDGGTNWQYLYRLPAPEGVPPLPNPRWSRPAVDQAWQQGEGHVGYPAIVDLPNGDLYVVWHCHNIHSPPAAPGRDTYGLVGNLLGNPSGAAENEAAKGTVFPVAQTGAILRAQIISGAGATASLIDPSAKLGFAITPQRIENRTSKEAEVHEAEDDVFYVLDGKATFHLGGTLKDTWTYAPGNRAGKEQVGATDYEVGPGDLVVVPHGTVHRITCPDGFVEVLMFKRTQR